MEVAEGCTYVERTSWRVVRSCRCRGLHFGAPVFVAGRAVPARAFRGYAKCVALLSVCVVSCCWVQPRVGGGYTRAITRVIAYARADSGSPFGRNLAVMTSPATPAEEKSVRHFVEEFRC